MNKISLLFLAPLFLAFNAYTQNITPVWANTIGGTGWDNADVISINPKNGIMVTGSFYDSITIDKQIHYSKGLRDIFIANFDFDGNFKNAHTFGGEADDFAVFGAYNGQSVLVSKHYGETEMLGNIFSSNYDLFYLATWFDDKGKITDQTTIEGSNGFNIEALVSEPSGAVHLSGWFNNEMKVDELFFSEPKSSQKSPFVVTLQKNGKQKEVLKGNEVLKGHVYAMCKGKGNELHVAGISGEENDPDQPRIVYRKMYAATIGSNGKVYDYQPLLKGMELKPVSIQSFNGYLWVASQFRHYCIFNSDTLKAINNIDILMVRINEKNGQAEAWTIGGHTRCIPLNLSVSNGQLILSGNFS
ncbi:MAG: hypothetical protein JW729_08730, partial [Bacteroidales bacterium]|nr:hypothetical protein [Bacteroidales bacterium]